MSMLAEPRRKNRYCLTPKGKPLFEDSDRFGTKMLEKMGWSKGKGLGKEEDGIQEFIRVKIKPDAIGLGFDIRDDQWTEHEKHFNGLLDNLNGDEASNENSTPNDGETVAPTVGLGFSSKSSKTKKLKDKFSGQSLEEKSKNSRARVHYKKFTKGKDISQYSEKDLANIFGKKPAPEDTNIYSQFQAFNAVENDSDEKEEIQKERKETGTINTGVSINDYFKMKMSAMQEKLRSSSSNPFSNNIRIINNVKMVVPGSNNNHDETITEEEVPQKIKKSKKQCNEIDESVSGTSIAIADTNEEKAIRKKKKHAKQLEDSNQEGSDVIKDQELEFNNKTKKKNKQLLEFNTEESTPSDDIRQSENQPKKKKKSKKNSSEENTVISCVPLEDEIAKKTKKSKKRSAGLEEDDDIEESVPIKKKKSKKSVENQSEETCSEENSVSVQIETFSESTNQDSEVTNSTNVTQEEEIKLKKSKKKKKNKTKTPTASNEEVSSHQKDLNSLTDVNNCLIDTLTISTFCAEKFRNIEADKFKGSNLMNLNGYGLSENLQLKIKNIAHDAERIMRLWSGTLNKYTHSTAEKKMYSSYVKKAKNARRANKNIPKLRAKNLKRKNVFQCV